MLAVVGGVGIAAGDLVGPVEVVVVAAGIEGSARLVDAVDQRNRESGRDSLDQRRSANPPRMALVTAFQSPPNCFALAERQIVDDAAGEAVIEIDLRQRPIEVLPVGQREVGRAQLRSQAVGQAVVVGARVGVGNQRVKAVLGRLGLRLDLH